MAAVRLRPRPTRERGADWVEPSGAATWTSVGNLDGAARGVVDPAGLVAGAGRGWSLDWWIGAEDRWHVPAREAAVRQALLGASPVVETRVRIPSGDAVQRVYAARGPDGEDTLVVEVQNDSKVPFALALSVRPYGLDGQGRVESIELDSPLVRVDGEVALVLPRSPGRIALSSAEGGDAAEQVFAGRAEPASASASAVTCPDGLANGALLFPLAHTATLRVALPLGSGVAVDPGMLPSADQVVSGWGSQARQGARIEVPDRRLREAISASTRYLLLAGADPRLASALDLMGFGGEAATALLADPVRLAATDAPGAALHALGWHWHLTRDAETAVASLSLVAALVRSLGRSRGDDADGIRGRAALPLVADLLDAAGEARGAADVRSVMVGAPEPVNPVAPMNLEDCLASASPTWTWSAGTVGHDLTANAALLTAVRCHLVQEDERGLALSPVIPDGWLGQGWEVHDLPTGVGRLSYAIRWHGERPALLWELDPHPGLPVARLHAPSLDPGWSTRERSGETLLAPVAVPARPAGRRGVSLPVTIEPMRRSAP